MVPSFLRLCSATLGPKPSSCSPSMASPLRAPPSTSAFPLLFPALGQGAPRSGDLPTPWTQGPPSTGRVCHRRARPSPPRWRTAARPPSLRRRCRHGRSRGIRRLSPTGSASSDAAAAAATSTRAAGPAELLHRVPWRSLLLPDASLGARGGLPTAAGSRLATEDARPAGLAQSPPLLPPLRPARVAGLQSPCLPSRRLQVPSRRPPPSAAGSSLSRRLCFSRSSPTPMLAHRHAPPWFRRALPFPPRRRALGRQRALPCRCRGLPLPPSLQPGVVAAPPLPWLHACRLTGRGRGPPLPRPPKPPPPDPRAPVSASLDSRACGRAPVFSP